MWQGLAVGIAACLLIFLVIQYEKSFDNFHPDKDRIYRVSVHFNTPDGISFTRGICFPAGKAIAPGLSPTGTGGVHLRCKGNQLTVLDENNHPQNKFKENGLFYIEPQFFDIFHFPFMAGNPKTALSAPNTIVLTQGAAEKYFGDWRKAIGRIDQVPGW